MTAPRLTFALLSLTACLLATTACTSASPADLASKVSTGVGSSDAPDASMTGTLTYANGSVPPPGHHRLDLEITGDEFTLTWSGYDDEVGRTTGVPLDLPGAQEILDNAGVLTGECEDDGRVGGPSADVDLTVDGTTIQSDVVACEGGGGAGDVLAAIQAIAGADVVSGALADVEQST